MEPRCNWLKDGKYQTNLGTLQALPFVQCDHYRELPKPASISFYNTSSRVRIGMNFG